MYIFDQLSGKLMTIGGYVHNVTLSLRYSEDMIRSIEHSDSGKRLSVNYTSNGLIESIELLNADNTVEKARCIKF